MPVRKMDAMTARKTRPAPPAGTVVPIAGADQWTDVMSRADYRCQCTRPHPHHRNSTCGKSARPGVRLIAGPVDPGPHPERTVTATDPGALIAWCPTCWKLAVKHARDAREQLSQVDPEPMF